MVLKNLTYQQLLKAFLLITVVCSNISLIAQTSENPWSIGLYGVKTEYLGDMRYRYANVTTEKPANTIFNFSPVYGGAALSVDRYLSRFFDAGIYFSAGTFGFQQTPEKDKVFYSENLNNFKVSPLLNGNLHLRIKFLGQGDDARVVPYIVLGAGALDYMNFSTQRYAKKTGDQHYSAVTYTYVEEKSPDYPAYAAIASGGLGVEFRLSPHFGIRYQAEAGWTNSDKNDKLVLHKGNDWQLQHSLGLSYNFGKSIKKKEKRVEEPMPVQNEIIVENFPPVIEQPKEEAKPEPEVVVQKTIPVVNNLLFEFDKAELTTASQTLLNSKIAELREADVSILIKGHTDSTGSETYNQKLSLKRAETVKNYLIEKGVSRDKITVQGYGETQPVASNNTAEGRAANRRVEFVFGE
jgi:outer membrane protein OmpA-like peptidoglycan-associated protein